MQRDKINNKKTNIVQGFSDEKRENFIFLLPILFWRYRIFNNESN